MQWHRPLSTIAPTLDTDVLAILARADARFTTGQLHRLLPDFSQEGIRKALGRLVEQGVVDAEQVGRTFGYQFNREHLAAGPIMELARMRTTLLERLEQRIASWAVPALYGAVFGSAARGTMQVPGDVDLFLVHTDGADSGEWERQVRDLAVDVTRWTGNDVRVLEMSEAEVRASSRAGVVDDVLAEGLTVAGRRRWLVAAFGTGVPK